MRIGLVSTLCTPVSRDHAGSVEGLVWLLAREFFDRGHDVTVFGIAGSLTAGRTVETLPGTYGKNGAPDDWELCEWINLCQAIGRSRHFDVIHAHAYLWSIPLEPLSSAPLLHTMHVMPNADSARLRHLYPRAMVSAVSEFQWSQYPSLPPLGIVPHGVNAELFTYRATADDYVCFLGRFTEGKDPLAAIVTAREMGVRLVMAGPRNTFYDEVVAPHVDGKWVRYVGTISGDARDALLGGAKALLYPVRAPEPFGLVMIEAMMCGTPVVATLRGAVGEIVEDGLTGFAVERVEDLAGAAQRAIQLDRRLVRNRALERFSSSRMAEGYLQLYRHLCHAPA